MHKSNSSKQNDTKQLKIFTDYVKIIYALIDQFLLKVTTLCNIKHAI